MTQLQRVDQTAPSLITAFTREQIDLIKRTVAKGATDDELKLFLYQAQKMGLDPLARQIYFQKRKNRKTGEETMTILVGIDGYRACAARTGQCAGNDDPVFDNEERPTKATVTVYRIVGGVRCPFTATARWDQYYPGEYQGFMWNKMPHLMLGKCAEALALRKAFPAELSGTYAEEEMHQAGPPIETQAQELIPAAKEPSIVDGVFDPKDEVQREAPKPKSKRTAAYDGSTAHQTVLKAQLKEKEVPEERWEDIHKAMIGKTSGQLDGVLKELGL